MRTTALAAALLFTTVGGCADSGGNAGNTAPAGSSNLPTHAPAVSGPAITGTVRADGDPVPGARITVTLLRSSAERTSIGLGAAFSLGLSCLVERRGCRAPTADGATARDGTFAVGLPKNNGAPPVGVALTVVATANDPRSGADNGQNDFRVGTTLVLPAADAAGAVADVPVAARALQLPRSGTHLDVVMPPVAGAAVTGPATLAVSQLTAEGDVSGATTDFSRTTVHLPFDLRLAEDSRLLLDAAQPARVGGYEATLSATRVLAGDSVPASRGAGCEVTDSRGRPRPQHPCGLTDGVLGTPWHPDDDPACARGPCPGTAQNDHRDIVVTLARAVPATLIAVRGCGFTCVVTVSSDGRHFRDLPAPANSPVEGFYVQPLSGAPVRYVHIRIATGGFFEALREVSVFG